MNKLFALLISLSLMLPVLAVENAENISEINPSSQEEIVSDETNLNDIQPTDSVIQTEEQSRFKQPVSKKKLAKKFVIAMLCVAGASFLLYAVLSIYNKIRDSVLIQDPSNSDIRTSLDTPQDLSEAVKKFVDKTNWNG